MNADSPCSCFFFCCCFSILVVLAFEVLSYFFPLIVLSFCNLTSCAFIFFHVCNEGKCLKSILHVSGRSKKSTTTSVLKMNCRYVWVTYVEFKRLGRGDRGRDLYVARCGTSALLNQLLAFFLKLSCTVSIFSLFYLRWSWTVLGLRQNPDNTDS